jgi:hypothetical protein
MANQGNVFEENEAIADEFDPFEFADQLFTTIQSMRSDNSAMPNTFFEGPLDITGAVNGESKINAFLRIIGFPATRDEKELGQSSDRMQTFQGNVQNDPNFRTSGTSTECFSEDERDRLLSQDDTLNYFSPNLINPLSADSDVPGDLYNREFILDGEATQKKFINMLRNPLELNSSVDGVPNRRTSIFPLVVSADIPVFPLKKRLAPFFYNGDYILNRTRASRPFLEHVIYIRTKYYAGLESPLQASLISNIQSEVRSELGDVNPVDELLADLTKYKTIELQVIQKFIKALKIAAKQYLEVLDRAEKLKAHIDWIPVSKVEPSEKVGDDSSLSIDERDEKIKEADDIEEVSVKVIDKEISNIQAEINRIDQYLQLLPTESVKQRDEIRRIGEQVPLNNIVGDLFLSEFNFLTSFERKALVERLDEAKRKRGRYIQQYESVKSLIMYFSGEFVGLSIFDVICVLFALFTVENKYLIGLLNKDAQKRLVENDLFYAIQDYSQRPIQRPGRVDDIVADSSSVTPAEAVSEVQQKAFEYFDLASAFFQNFKTTENKQNKE